MATQTASAEHNSEYSSPRDSDGSGGTTRATHRTESPAANAPRMAAGLRPAGEFPSVTAAVEAVGSIASSNTAGNSIAGYTDRYVAIANANAADAPRPARYRPWHQAH